MEELLLKYLSDGRWHTAGEIKNSLGITRDDIRALGLLADGRLIGSTTQGFKLTAAATSGEVKRALASLKSRRAVIQERIEAIEARLAA